MRALLKAPVTRFSRKLGEKQWKLRLREILRFK
jgi:hypothetical protein